MQPPPRCVPLSPGVWQPPHCILPSFPGVPLPLGYVASPTLLCSGTLQAVWQPPSCVAPHCVEPLPQLCLLLWVAPIRCVSPPSRLYSSPMAEPVLEAASLSLLEKKKINISLEDLGDRVSWSSLQLWAQDKKSYRASQESSLNLPSQEPRHHPWKDMVPHHAYQVTEEQSLHITKVQTMHSLWLGWLCKPQWYLAIPPLQLPTSQDMTTLSWFY